jgi:hypothetical protein
MQKGARLWVHPRLPCAKGLSLFAAETLGRITPGRQRTLSSPDHSTSARPQRFGEIGGRIERLPTTWGLDSGMLVVLRRQFPRACLAALPGPATIEAGTRHRTVGCVEARRHDGVADAIVLPSRYHSSHLNPLPLPRQLLTAPKLSGKYDFSTPKDLPEPFLARRHLDTRSSSTDSVDPKTRRRPRTTAASRIRGEDQRSGQWNESE